MAKDPRFNFYVDNWIGGTEGFTLEQDGAYLALILMQSRVGRFTEVQAIDKLMQRTRGNTAVSTGLWKFLIPKFMTDGVLFWSERLETEMGKSKVHSEKQSERVKKRWLKENGIDSGNTTVLPDNRSGSGIGNGIDNNWIEWGKLIVEQNDQHWDAMKGRRISQDEMDSFLSVATRNSWTMKTQNEFRVSLKGFKVTGSQTQQKNKYKIQ